MPSPSRAVSIRWVRRVAVAATVAVTLGYVPYHLYASSGLARYLKLRAERDALHAANLRTLAETQALRAELAALTEDDPDAPTHDRLSRQAVERAARDELGLVRPGEIVFKLEGADAPR